MIVARCRSTFAHLTPPSSFFFFFNDTATTEIYTLSLHDALPIYPDGRQIHDRVQLHFGRHVSAVMRSEEHTSELQSRSDLVCRLLLEKKKIPQRRLEPLRANTSVTDAISVLHENFGLIN